MERAALIGAVKVRLLETDEKFSLRGETLQRAIEKDREAGLIPFFVRSHNFTIIIPQKRRTLITHDGNHVTQGVQLLKMMYMVHMFHMYMYTVNLVNCTSKSVQLCDL